MRVFLDFEASSLRDHSYPIEIGWVFEDGRSASHLIRPAPHWTDWDPRAEAIHGLSRATLLTEGEDAAAVSHAAVAALAGHDLFASAPSWDGKWLSVLLRIGDHPRHALRLRDTEVAMAEAARAILEPWIEAGVVEGAVAAAIATADAAPPEAVAHRALADAAGERRRFQRAVAAARAIVARSAGTEPGLRA